MVQVVRVHELGGFDNLLLEDLPIEEPASDEIRVAFDAIGLNRAEAALRTGTYVFQPDLPFRLGFEGAGRVTAVGGEVTDLDVGDYVSFVPAVMSFEYGTYAEEALMPARFAVKTPHDIAPSAAAAMWMQYLTAFGGLVEAGGLRAGESVLITAASSSVGLAAIQICRKLGAVPIAVTRTRDKSDALRAAGAAHVISLADEKLVETVLDVTHGAGADLIFDCVAGDGVHELAEAAAFNARIIIYGALTGPAAPFPFFPAVKKGLSMRAFYLIELTEKPEWLARAKAFTLAGVCDGSLEPIIDRTFALSEVREAQARVESNAQVGKIVMLTESGLMTR